MGKKLTTKEFIKQAKEIHGDKYDYSRVEYVNSQTKVCIICPIHGEFWQTPNGHLDGHGCRQCGGTDKMSTEQFIEKAKAIHGDKYDYSKVEYKGNKIKVCIICPIHGEFWMKPNSHLSGQRCPKCYGNSKKTVEEFVEEARKVHGDKYDYSKVEYKGNHTKVRIICPIHGEFLQQPIGHLKGSGCPKCGKKRASLSITDTTENFIEKARKVHGNKYDYSKVEYVGQRKEVCIICPKHGEFWQVPNYHLQGCGCPKCALEELIYENKLYEILLDKLHCDIKRQKKFIWLKNEKKLSLDFFIPSKNVAIEYQGEQHFKKYRFEEDDTKLLERQNRDKIKIKLCDEHNVKLLHFSFSEKNCRDWKEYKVYTNVDELIEEINGYN